MRYTGLLFASLTLVVLLGCHTTVSPGNLSVKGTVHHIDLEGGYWAILGDDGTTYDPVKGLPAEYQTEGLRVQVEAKPRTDVVSFHMAGTMIEIVKIHKL
jgi:hypothetical protein